MYTIAQKTFAIGQNHIISRIFLFCLKTADKDFFSWGPARTMTFSVPVKYSVEDAFYLTEGPFWRRSLHVPKVYGRRCSLYLRFAKDTEVRGQQRRLSFGDTSGRRLSPHLRSMNDDFLGRGDVCRNQNGCVNLKYIKMTTRQSYEFIK